MSEGNLIEVRVIGVPVDIWQRASSHQEAVGSMVWGHSD